MAKYVALLRGINVGGKNKVPMADLRDTLEEGGYESVRTYIQSGNALMESTKARSSLESHIEGLLEARLDSNQARSLFWRRSRRRSIVSTGKAICGGAITRCLGRRRGRRRGGGATCGCVPARWRPTGGSVGLPGRTRGPVRRRRARRLVARGA